MGKLKEYFHEEICRKSDQFDEPDYAVQKMIKISDLCAQYLNEEVPAQRFINAVVKHAMDFDNMHTPTRP